MTDDRNHGIGPGRRRLLALAAVLALVALAGCTGSVGGDEELDTDIEFREATNETGLEYKTDGGGAGNGNDGVYVADVDRDGWQDVLAVGGEAPVLFANANGSFERARTFDALNETVKGALFFDADGDGDDDLLFLRSHAAPVLFRNDDGEFSRTDVEFGSLAYPMGATTADYDDDGDLDVFVYQSGDWARGKPEGYFSLNATLDVDNGNPNVLYENTADGFERVTDAGVSERSRWSLAASFVDLTGDGLPDLHVANDYNTDAVYVNEGDGTFAERPLRGNTSRNGMASEVFDANGDGALDVFTTNIYLPLSAVEDEEREERLRLLFGNVIKSGRTKGNTLLVNDGTGGFAERALAFDVRYGGWGWAATATDFDNDGDRDILHATQYVARLDQDDPHYTYPMLFERDGDGFETLDASARGLREDDGRGLASLDYDRDGDRDVVVAPYDGRVTVYENVGANANSLAVRVVDANGSTAFGATVTVDTGDGEQVVRQGAETDFLSQESRVASVGLGGDDEVDVAVTFPDGTRVTFEDVDANQHVRLSKDGIERVGTWETNATQTETAVRATDGASGAQA
jgi:hypothetical protein